LPRYVAPLARIYVDTGSRIPYRSVDSGNGDPCGKGVRGHMRIWFALMNLFNRDDEDGQGLAEYALILALIAIVAIVALIFLGGAISRILSTVGSSI